MMTNAYPGPAPESAPSSSSWRSVTTASLPSARKTSSASAMNPSEANVPGAIAAMPSPTEAGVFGMTRMTSVPFGRAFSSVSIVTAAAIERTRRGACRDNSSSTEGTTFGFTATMTRSASPASPPSLETETPYRAAFSSEAARECSFTKTSSFFHKPLARQPERIAPPIAPHPMISIFFIGSVLSRQGCLGNRSVDPYRAAQSPAGR